MHLPLNTLKSNYRFLRCLPLLVLLLSTSGCGSYVGQYYFGDLFGKGSSTTEKNPEQLALEGTDEMRKKDYEDALKAFKQLKEHYPYSKYAILAELKIGDAHFHQKEYGEAALAYEEFARLHPRNEVVPYVLYQIGMCHFLSFSTVDRDQEETRLAMESFQRVIQAYPQSEYAKKAAKQYFECQKRIVAHEYAVGEFYIHREKYRSAKERLDKISKIYPEAVKALGYQEAIGNMLAQCEKYAGAEDKPSVWTKLGF
jgi:outer membrane protein assembly factor BamD